MTAEVAVLNKTGVAIAADSAVTTGFPGSEKIFTSANKIFMLSKTEPVAIMINGHVEHFGLAWEVIIKAFRADLGARKFATLREYVDQFLAFASAPRFLNSDGQTVTAVVAALATYGEVRRRLAKAGEPIRAAPIREALQEMRAVVEGRQSLDALDGIGFAAFNSRYGDIVDGVVAGDQDLVDDPFPRGVWALFRRVTWLALKHRLATSFNTGLVFTGYGNDEFFPKLYEINVDGGLFDRIKMWEGTSYDMETSPEGSAITAFAQDDMVKAFERGADERFKGFMVGTFLRFFSRLSMEFIKHHTQYPPDERRVVEEMMASTINSALTKFVEEFDAFSREFFTDPITNVLRTAPKESLVELAESLIAITALRQRVSGELETVAGPVDVAVISKGDGFIWIKRKHYFRPELNHHFLKNYFREIGHGEGV
jgi:hypothetical protein